MGMMPCSIFLDSCLVIYFVEQHPRFSAHINQAIAANANMRFCISPLVELECLVMPLRQGNQVLVDRYEMFFQDYIRLEISQLCTMWSLNDPPGILEATDQLEALCEMIGMNIEEGYAVDLYDMTIKEAADSLYIFMASTTHKNPFKPV